MTYLNLEKPDQISSEWLNYVLRREGLLGASRVESIKKASIGGSKSWLSHILRLEAEYIPTNDLLPSSFVLKMLSKSEFRDLNYELGAYEREIRFYKQLAGKLPIRLPKIYCSQFSADSNLILMEDLSYLTEGDLVQGMSYKQILLTLEELAKVHSTYWENAKLDSFKWLPNNNNLHINYADNWESFKKLCGDFINSDSLQIGERLNLHISWLMKEIESGPRTLVHDDMKADNLLFNDQGATDEVVILDWQFVVKSLGAIDVARLIGGSMTPKEREGTEYELLRVWYEKLIDEGVTNYSWEEAQRDFKLGALSCLTFPIHFHKGIVRAEGRALEYVIAMYSRLFSHVVEIEADSVLP